jgi:hypothetical protein
MARKAGRRATQAANNSGGFLTRLSKSSVGRSKIIPAMTSLGLASQLSAEQARERLRTDASQIARTLDTNQRPAASTKTPGRLSKTELHPLGSRLDTGAQLDADRARSRRAAMNAPQDAAPLLQLPTRSYARPEETDTERELERQKQMSRTMSEFLDTQGTPDTEQPNVSPTSSQLIREREEVADEEREAASEQAILSAQEQDARAEQVAQAQEMDRMAQAERATQALRQGSLGGDAERLKHLQKMWRLVSGAEALSFEAIVPLLMLVVQLNVQVINHYFFQFPLIPPPSRPEQVACFCLDLLTCFIAFVACLFPIAIITIAYWGVDNAAEAIPVLSDLLF